MYPKVFFDSGVNCTDGIYTVRADELLDVIAQAGLGCRFSANLRKTRDELREPGF